MRSGQTRLLAVPEARGIRWRPLLAITPVSFLIVYAGIHDPGATKAIHIPFAGIALAVWAGFLFDDVASATVRSAPTPLLLRRGVRMLVALPVLAIAWTGLLWYADVWPIAGTLTAGFVAQVSVALGFGALGVLVVGSDRGGLLAVAGLVVVFMAVPLVMRGGILWADPFHDGWTYHYGRWIATSAVAFVLLVLASRDPAARGARAGVRALTGRAEPAGPAAR
ncbi:MAG: hypothetical protein ABI635_08880 [Actinomycetota bacterium]